MTEKKDPRIPEILRRRASGESFTSMAEDMNLSRKTLYNLRQEDSYLNVVNEMFVSLMDEIEEMSKSESHTIKIDALKEKGRILRALLPSLSVIQHKKDPEQRRELTAAEIVEKRKRSEALIRSLDLTPEQFRKLEESVQQEDEKE